MCGERVSFAGLDIFKGRFKRVVAVGLDGDAACAGLDFDGDIGGIFAVCDNFVVDQNLRVFWGNVDKEAENGFAGGHLRRCASRNG